MSKKEDETLLYIEAIRRLGIEEFMRRVRFICSEEFKDLVMKNVLMRIKKTNEN